ncbi:hypothetical protein D5Y80_24060, partial [Salmonella enterica subsp. enterica serovar Schwarzengrund]
ECVWAWINHFDLTNIAEIDPNTAKDFLTERCPTLSGQTISRRANTLSSWWKQLIPHYLDVKAVNDEKHQKNGV